jgi:small-conductance mechanosensitive channel
MKRYFISLSLAAFLLGGINAAAQEATPSPEKQGETIPTAPVMLGNETLFTILTQIKGVPIKDRAEVLSDRIKKIADDLSIPVESFDTKDYAEPMTVITAQQKLVAILLDEDATAAGRSRQELAGELSLKKRTASEKYRNEKRLAWLLRGVLFTLITTLGFVLILYFLNRFYRKAESLMISWVGRREIALRIQTVKLLQTELIQNVFTGVIRTIRFISFLVLIFFYLQIVLRFFPWTRPYAGQIDEYVLQVLGTVSTAVLVQFPNLVILLVIILITVYVLKLINLIFSGIANRTFRFKNFQPEWAHPTYRLCRIGVVAFALVIAFPYIPGSGSLAFKGISIFLGVLFSLGSTSAIANIISGYTIIYRNLFAAGDRVKIADFTGTVVKTGLQVIHLRTVKNEEITVPSSMIVNSQVINYSALARDRGLILHTVVTIGYDTPWRQVHALLIMAAERTPDLLHQPEPYVLQKSLDDFYVVYELNVYTDKPNAMEQIYSDLHKNIQDAFNEYGVQIMSPSYRDDPAKPKVVPKEQWYATPAKPSAERAKKD